MILGRLLGWLMVAAAIVVTGRDLLNYWYRGAWTFVSAGELWTHIHPESVQALQPAVQRQVFALYPEIWDRAFVPVLGLPAAALLGGLGLVLVLLFRRRRPRRSFLH